MTENRKIRVLLADDHPYVREGIRSSLATCPQLEIVGEAVNGQEAIEKGKNLAPDVVVMDITMPIMNGLEATRLLRQAAPDVRVLILTMHGKKEFTSEIVQSGARGYVNKNTSPAELVRAIQWVHRGDTFFSPKLNEALLQERFVHGDKSGLLKSNELSPREREVLTLIAEGFCNKEAAGMLGVSVRTVEKHRERIMAKLDLHSIVDLTRYAVAKQMVEVN